VAVFSSIVVEVAVDVVVVFSEAMAARQAPEL